MGRWEKSTCGTDRKRSAINLEDIKRINQLFAEFYPYLARQIANAYGREDGLALEIGPYGLGISIELTKLCPGLRVVGGDNPAEVLSYLEKARWSTWPRPGCATLGPSSS